MTVAVMVVVVVDFGSDFGSDAGNRDHDSDGGGSHLGSEACDRDHGRDNGGSDLGSNSFPGAVRSVHCVRPVVGGFDIPRSVAWSRGASQWQQLPPRWWQWQQ